jgi:NADP-dependent 3-hydroxy acid dehydrogenase YdfG
MNKSVALVTGASAGIGKLRVREEFAQCIGVEICCVRQ